MTNRTAERNTEEEAGNEEDKKKLKRNKMRKIVQKDVG